MKKLFALGTLLFLLSFSYITFAQLPGGDASTISISMSATEEIPADLIIFNININAEGDTPRDAFNLHKKREAVLAGLLKKLEITEDNINYQPIGINKQSRNRGKDQYSVTNQQVSVTFDDFDIYEEVQLTLIENDFDQFSANFSSTELESGKENALLSAIELARRKAETIAEAANVELAGIHYIQYAEHSIRSYRKSNMEMAVMSAAEPSMMDFAQTVSVTANINIYFKIGN